jgi:hypothetical protein
MPHWIRFELLRDPTRKTKIWRVVNAQYNSFLGNVKWYSPWRKYCFAPDDGTVFEQDCLRDIAAFCEDETRAHNAALKAAT